MWRPSYCPTHIGKTAIVRILRATDRSRDILRLKMKNSEPIYRGFGKIVHCKLNSAEHPVKKGVKPLLASLPPRKVRGITIRRTTF